MIKILDWKKSTVRDFFDHFFVFLVRKLSYTDLSKNGPHKKHCAWARTPPLAKSAFLLNFIDFYRFQGLQ
jgi:hypothetical protein